MSRLKNLDCIQALVKDLQSSRNEILLENEKLANEVVKLKKDLNEIKHSKDEMVSENKELASEVFKLNQKLEEYKKLYSLDNRAKDNLQYVIATSQNEREKLEEQLKAKDDALSKMKTDFETFMEEVCDENKKLRVTLESREKEFAKADKFVEQNEKYKNYIQKLEKEVMECLKKIACLQELIIDSDKRNEELSAENMKLEKKFLKITEKLESSAAILEETKEDNKKLTETINQLKSLLTKNEKHNTELMSEIEKFDRLTCTMENQLKDNQTYIKQLEDFLNKDKACKINWQLKVETMTAELEQEKRVRENLEQELCITKQAHKRCEECLSETRLALDKTCESFQCYKRNIQNLRKQIQSRASHSCPPIYKGKSTCRSVPKKKYRSSCLKPKPRRTSCELLYRNSKRLKSLLSCQISQISDPCICEAIKHMRSGFSKDCVSPICRMQDNRRYPRQKPCTRDRRGKSSRKMCR